MCDKSYTTLRDREFDSEVRAMSDRVSYHYDTAPERIEAGTERAEPFSAIDAAWNNIQAAVASGDLQGAQEVAQKAVDDTLQPYYKGLGQFDHVRFLADLETSKGARLNQSEAEFFGSIVGDWTAIKHIAEIEAIPDRNARDEARLNAVLFGL